MVTFINSLIHPSLISECGDWSAFSDCSKSCGGGMKTRWRTCGGSIVEDKLPCNEAPCPSTNETDYGTSKEKN